MTTDPIITPAHAIVAGVRAAQSAFPPSDDTPYDRAKRATAAIAEAGLALRDALGATVADPRGGWYLPDDNRAAAVAAYDAAVRAACGEGV